MEVKCAGSHVKLYMSLGWLVTVSPDELRVGLTRCGVAVKLSNESRAEHHLNQNVYELHFESRIHPEKQQNFSTIVVCEKLRLFYGA